MAELYGKGAGCCHGKGGSLHVADTSVGCSAPTESLPETSHRRRSRVRAGKMLKNGKIVVAFLGDGATNEGAFHEA